MKKPRSQDIFRMTDGRFSGGTKESCIGHVSPAASVGGPIAVVGEDDEICINIQERTIEVTLADHEIRSRTREGMPRRRHIPAGFLRRYVKYLSSAARGAVLE